MPAAADGAGFDTAANGTTDAAATALCNTVLLSRGMPDREYAEDAAKKKASTRCRRSILKMI